MRESNRMPPGVVPGICWLSQRLREHFQRGERPLEEDSIEFALHHLDEALSEMMNSIKEIEDETASSLWETCEDILGALYSAWEETCESYLGDLNDLLARAYELMARLEEKLAEDYSLSLSA